MPSSNKLAQLPPAAQQQLLGSGSLGGLSAAPQKMPPVTSPEYAAMVQHGIAPVPPVGTMEYLDFAGRYPDLVVGDKRRKQAASSFQQYNPFDILAAVLSQQ